MVIIAQYSLLVIQGFCLVRQCRTDNNRWMIGSFGIMPIVVLLGVLF